MRLSGASRLAVDEPLAAGVIWKLRMFGRHVDNTRTPPDPGATHAKVSGKGRTFTYCFSATYWLVVPWSLSVIAMVIVFPSGATVM